jgi:hypothetical protein
MKTKIKFLGVLFLLLTGQLTYGQKNGKIQVQQSFENYKSAILNDRGEDAVKYVDSRTIKYYGDILEIVITADSSKVETLPFLDKLMVFSIRHRMLKEDILSFDGKSLLVYAIKSGMVGKNNVINNSIGDVIINNDFAKGQFIVSGQKTPFYFNFYKEEGQWKTDLTSLFPVTNLAFNKMVDESGENQNDYLFSLLETVTGRKPGAEIWQPINR